MSIHEYVFKLKVKAITFSKFSNKISLFFLNKFQLTIVEILVEMLMDSCPEDSQGRTPLHYAAMNGHLEVIKLLIPVTKVCNSLRGIDNKTV